jgi:hypothetical protein
MTCPRVPDVEHGMKMWNTILTSTSSGYRWVLKLMQSCIVTHPKIYGSQYIRERL